MIKVFKINSTYIFIILLLSTAISCTSSTTHNTEIELGSTKEIDLSENCHCDSLLKNESGFLELDGEVYTGNCFSNYPLSDQKYLNQQLLEGQIHGKITYYDKNGEVLFSESYNSGKRIGNDELLTECSCNKLKLEASGDVKKYYLNDIVFTGHCQDYFHESEQLYLEADYQDGLIHGYAIYYNKDGSVLMIQDYDHGVLLKEIFPKD